MWLNWHPGAFILDCLYPVPHSGMTKRSSWFLGLKTHLWTGWRLIPTSSISLWTGFWETKCKDPFGKDEDKFPLCTVPTHNIIAWSSRKCYCKNFKIYLCINSDLKGSILLNLWSLLVCKSYGKNKFILKCKKFYFIWKMRPIFRKQLCLGKKLYVFYKKRDQQLLVLFIVSCQPSNQDCFNNRKIDILCEGSAFCRPQMFPFGRTNLKY